MASTSRQYSPTPETANGCRVMILVQEPCPDALRDLLRLYIPPNAITGKLQQEKKKKKSFLHNTKLVSSKQLTNLCPLSGAYNGNYAEFDITFIYTLLRNLANIPQHSNGWGEEPKPNDRSVAANIDRIRLLRNEFSHRPSLSLSDTDFQKNWSETKLVMRELDTHLSNGGKYEKIIDDLEHKQLDPTEATFWKKTLKRRLKEEKHCKEDIKKLKSEQGELKSKLKEMEIMNKIIPSNVQEIHADLLKNWKQDDNHYYEPSFFKSLMEKVDKNSLILVIGSPGSGKTASIHHVALKLENREFDVVPIAKVKEIITYGIKGKKQVFTLDDAFGDICFQRRLHDKFKQYYEKMCAVLGDGSKLLMTSRTIVKMEAERFNLHSAILENVFDLDNEENRLTKTDRLEILSNHMKDSPSFAKIQDYVNRTDKIIMFPLLCKLVSSNIAYEKECCQFFKEPCKHILKNLEELEKEKRTQYASLVLCMLNKGKLSENDLEEKLWLKSIWHKCCKVPKTVEIWEFTEALSDMIGTYVTKTPSAFVFLHDLFFEVIACKFGEQYPEEIIERLSGELISKNLILQENEKTSDLQIHIKQHMFPCLARRLLKELKEFQLYNVFDSKLLHNRELLNHFLEYLKQHPYKETKERFLKPTENFNSSIFLLMSKSTEYIDERTHIDFLARALIENAQSINVEDPSDFFDEYKSEMLLKPEVKQVMPLSWVVAYGHTFLLEYILENVHAHNDSADIFGYDLEDQSRYLVLACYSRCSEMVTLVLKNTDHSCINLNPFKRRNEEQIVPPHFNFTPLKMAILQGSSTIVDILLRANADINAMDIRGATPIWTAIYASKDFLFKELISNNADVNKFKQGIESPLILAAYFNKSDILDILLRNGADCNYRSSTGASALYWASCAGNFESVKKLIECGAEVSMYVDEDKSPFCIAAKKGHRSIVELLYANGAKCNLNDENGCCPIYLASNAGHTDIVKFLIEKDADIEGKNALIAAISTGRTDIAIMLIQAGADRNEQRYCFLGLTSALHEAVKVNMATVIQALHGPDLNYRVENDAHITPLETAVWMGQKEIIHLLIKGENSITTGSGNKHLFEVITKIRSSNLKLNHKDEIEAEDKEIDLIIPQTSSVVDDVLVGDFYNSLNGLLSLGLRGDRFI